MIASDLPTSGSKAAAKIEKLLQPREVAGDYDDVISIAHVEFDAETTHHMSLQQTPLYQHVE